MMDEPPDLEACFKQGMRARECGTAYNANPYALKTAEHREWAAGWSATFDLDEDDDAQSMRVKSGPTDRSSGWDNESE